MSIDELLKAFHCLTVSDQLAAIKQIIVAWKTKDAQGEIATVELEQFLELQREKARIFEKYTKPVKR